MNRLKEILPLIANTGGNQQTDDGLKIKNFSHQEYLSVANNNSITTTISKLLIVDPDENFAQSLSEYLILFGYQIDSESQIDSALNRAKIQKIDLILLADNFNQFHPIDLLRKFKQQTPNTLIVILADRGDDQLAVELLKSGAHDYLSRRIKDKNLFTSIATLLKGFQLEASLNQQNIVATDPLTQAITIAHTQNIKLDPAVIKTNALYSSEEVSPASSSVEEKISLTIDDVPGAHFFLDENLSIINLSKTCCELFSFFCNEIRGISMANIMPARFFTELRQQVEYLLTSQSLPKQQLTFELVVLNQAGKGLPLKCCLTKQTIKDYDQSIKSGFFLSVSDLSDDKAHQAELYFKSMWSEMLQRFSNRFINLRLDDFSTELAKIISDVAVFYRLDRVSIYLMVAKGTKAKIYLEWIKKDQESLKQFSKKIDVDKNLIEIKKMVNGELQLLSPVSTIENSESIHCFGLSEHYAQVNSQSSAVLPITKGKNIIGWLSLDKSDISRQWSREDLAILQPFSTLISEIFRRRSREEHNRITHQKLSENHGRLSEHAFLDGLTNLANRRSFNKVLESETRRSSREMSSITLLFIDVDYFKNYNDTYGHLSGDSCLQSIADVLKNEFKRAGDFVARFGGEEFTVLLPGCSLENAADAAEKLRATIESLNLEHQSSPLEKVTISIGVCCLELAKANAAKELLSQADKALYRAKNNGRNIIEAVKI